MTLVDRDEGDDVADGGLDGRGFEDHRLAIAALVEHLHFDFGRKGGKGEKTCENGEAGEFGSSVLHNFAPERKHIHANVSLSS